MSTRTGSMRIEARALLFLIHEPRRCGRVMVIESYVPPGLSVSTGAQIFLMECVMPCAGLIADKL